MDLIFQLLRDFPRSDHQWIGLEVERIVLNRSDEVVRYEPDVRQCLEKLISEKAWQVDYAPEGKILAIKKNLHSISVEPGGQFEVSPAPRKNICEIAKLEAEIEGDIHSVAPDWKWLCIGMNPWQSSEQIPLLPSPRYQLMDAHFKRLKGRGAEMMRLTTGLQVNLDYSSPEEAMDMLRAAFLLAPVMSAAFSNSPFVYSKRSKLLSERHLIWKATDPARSGFLPGVFQRDFKLENYTERIANIPLMYAYDLDDRVFDPQGRCFNDLSPSLQKKNALAALRQMFSEVRLKPCCVEIRYFDEQSPALRYAATAMIAGLIYSTKNREKIRERFQSMTESALEKAMLLGAEKGFEDTFIYENFKILLEWAEEGLKTRGYGEEKFLAAAEELLRQKKTPAEQLMASGFMQ